MTQTTKEHQKIRVTREAVREYWQHMQQHGQYDHPAFEKKDHIPVGVSGDDARWNLAGDKLIVLLLNAIVQEVEPLDACRFPWFVLRHDLCIGMVSLDPVLRVAHWSFEAMFLGAYPSLSPTGQPLPASRRPGQPLPGGRFALVELRGDWKWHLEFLRLRRSHASNRLCFLCDAAKSAGDQQYTNFETFPESFPLASTSKFINCSLGPYVNPLLLVTGVCAPHMVAYCSMHVSNLGILQWCNAATVVKLLSLNFFGPPGAPLAHKLAVLTTRFRKWCNLHDIPYPVALRLVFFFFGRWDRYPQDPNKALAPKTWNPDQKTSLPSRELSTFSGSRSRTLRRECCTWTLRQS